MPETPPPRRVDLDITDPRFSQTSTRRYAPYQGDTYEDSFQILDVNGDPLDTTGMVARAQFRVGVLDEAPDSLGSATVTWTDATIGQGSYKLSPTTTASFPSAGVWDLELENDTNPDFDADYRKTIFFGTWVCMPQVTEV